MKPKTSSQKINQQLHNTLYLTLQRFRRRPVGAYMHQMRAWENLDNQSYVRLVRQRLDESLSYARRHVPLYSSPAWESCLGRDRHLDLTRWPVLERQVLHDFTDDLAAQPEVKGIIYRQSSASTDKPVRIRWDPPAAAWIWANEYRTLQWHGVEIGARTLILWGFQDRFTNWVLNRRYFSTQNLTAAELDAAARCLVEERPDLVWGMPSAVAQLARYVGDQYPDAPRPLAGFTKLGGEQVFPFQRQEIERYLGARPISAYGCSEMGAVAGECPHGSMHIFAPHVHIEIFHGDQPAPPGELGDLVLTTLSNRAMPLIRYRQGDMGALSPDPCPCGLPHPVLSQLKARAKDRFETPDGRFVHGSALGEALEQVVGQAPLGFARQFLFEQVSPRLWKVRVEGEVYSPALVEQVARVVRTAFGEGIEVEVERVDYIPREASGKYRYYRKL
jgi:phenylacetate-CoA ligase